MSGGIGKGRKTSDFSPPLLIPYSHPFINFPTFCWRNLLQCLQKWLVAVIDILAEMNGAILFGPSGHINQMYGYGAGNEYRPLPALFDGFPDMGRSPLWLVLEQEFCQLQRLADPDASRAE